MPAGGALLQRCRPVAMGIVLSESSAEAKACLCTIQTLSSPGCVRPRLHRRGGGARAQQGWVRRRWEPRCPSCLACRGSQEKNSCDAQVSPLGDAPGPVCEARGSGLAACAGVCSSSLKICAGTRGRQYCRPPCLLAGPAGDGACRAGEAGGM